MFSASSSEPAWTAPPSTSGWALHPYCLRLFGPPRRRSGCEWTQVRLPPCLLLDLATLLPPLIESLCLLFESGTVNPQVDPRSVDSLAVQKMLIYINQWTKNLNNVKYLNTHPVEKDLILGLYGVASKAFSNIRIYSKAPPPVPPSPKVADSLSSPQTHPSPLRPHPTAPVAVLVTLAAGTTAGGSAQKKKKAVERSGTSCDMTCACADPPSPPSPVPHDTHLLEGKNHVRDSPAGFACGPIIRRPGNCCCPFNTSNSPSH